MSEALSNARHLPVLQIFFSNTRNNLQTKCYLHFTDEETEAHRLSNLAKVTKLELRSLTPNIVFSPTFYSEIFQTFRKVARML